MDFLLFCLSPPWLLSVADSRHGLEETNRSRDCYLTSSAATHTCYPYTHNVDGYPAPTPRHMQYILSCHPPIHPLPTGCSCQVCWRRCRTGWGDLSWQIQWCQNLPSCPFNLDMSQLNWGFSYIIGWYCFPSGKQVEGRGEGFPTSSAAFCRDREDLGGGFQGHGQGVEA